MKFIFALIVLLTVSSSALSQSAIDILFMQEELQTQGLLKDKPDGKLGKNTKAAMKLYARQYGVSADYVAIISNMHRLNSKARVAITDQHLLEAIRTEVSNGSKRASRTKLRNVYKLESREGLVCGELIIDNSDTTSPKAIPFLGTFINDDRFFLIVDLSRDSALYSRFKCDHHH